MILRIDPTNLAYLQGTYQVIRHLAKGTFFTAEFRKQDGTFRRMNCRLGVKKYVKDPSAPYTPKPFNGTMTVYDVRLREYRSIRLDRLERLKIRGVDYVVEHTDKW